MLSQLYLKATETSEMIRVHQLRWARQRNCMDRLFLRVLPNSIPSNTTKLTLFWEDSEVPVWMYYGPTKEIFDNDGEGQWLAGNLIAPERHAYFERSEDKFVIFQVSKEENAWTEIFQEITGKCEDKTKHKTAPIMAALPHPATFIKPPGWTLLRFLTQLVSTIHLHVPQIYAWHLRDAYSSFVLDTGESTLHEKWANLSCVQSGDNGVLSYFFSRSAVGKEIISTLTQCILGDQEPANTGGLFPASITYKDCGREKSLCFHRFEAVYPSPSNEVTMELELFTQPTIPSPAFPPLTVKGVFQSWNDDGNMWKVLLTDGNVKDNTEIFAYPRMPFSGNRGVYVPPKHGDEVLVTIPHGGFPVADILTIKPGDDYEKTNVSIVGKSVLVEGTDSVDVKSKQTKISEKLNVGKDVAMKSNARIDGKLKVGSM